MLLIDTCATPKSEKDESVMRAGGQELFKNGIEWNGASDFHQVYKAEYIACLKSNTNVFC